MEIQQYEKAKAVREEQLDRLTQICQEQAVRPPISLTSPYLLAGLSRHITSRGKQSPSKWPQIDPACKISTKDAFKTDHISALHNSFTEVLYPTPDSPQCALSQHNLLTASQFNNSGSVIVLSRIIPFRDQLSKCWSF